MSVSEKTIASAGRVLDAVRQVVRNHLKIETQEQLARLALKILRKESKSTTLSPLRAKRIALQIPEIEVRAKTKRSTRLQKITSCPVCEGSIKEVTVKNLLNKNIAVGYRCTICGYQADLEAFMPMKYVFLWSPEE